MVYFDAMANLCDIEQIWKYSNADKKIDRRNLILKLACLKIELPWLIYADNCVTYFYGLIPFFYGVKHPFGTVRGIWLLRFAIANYYIQYSISSGVWTALDWKWKPLWNNLWAFYWLKVKHLNFILEMTTSTVAHPLPRLGSEICNRSK